MINAIKTVASLLVCFNYNAWAFNHALSLSLLDFWYDMYLKDRRSIVLNHNPFLTFHDDTRNPSQVSTYYFIHFIIIIIINCVIG